MPPKKPPTVVEIVAPVAGAALSSPLAIVRVRYENAAGRTATLLVGKVKHVIELPGPSGELRENVTLLEGRNELEASIGRTSHEVEVEVAPSKNITIAAPQAKKKIATRATELQGSYKDVSCPAGVISVNGFMQQFAVRGREGSFDEKIVLRPGANHLAVQVGEFYATRLVTGTFKDAKLLVTLVWDTGNTDVDLYVKEPNEQSVWYRNKTSAGGGSLDVDRTQGYGPENYSMGTPGEPVRPGTYRVRVHFFSDRGVGRTEWTVRVIADEGTGEQQRRSFYGILDVSNSGNAEPGEAGRDWSEVCEVRVSDKGEVTFGG